MITMVVSKGSESFTVSQLIKFCMLVASKLRGGITKIRTLLDYLDYIYSKSPILFTFGSQHGEQQQLRVGKVGIPVIKVYINESHLC